MEINNKIVQGNTLWMTNTSNVSEHYIGVRHDAMCQSELSTSQKSLFKPQNNPTEWLLISL